MTVDEAAVRGTVERIQEALEAARAMLVALEDAEKILAQLKDAGYMVHLELWETRAAITQAKAAGIEPAGRAKGDAP